MTPRTSFMRCLAQSALFALSAASLTAQTRPAGGNPPAGPAAAGSAAASANGAAPATTPAGATAAAATPGAPAPRQSWTADRRDYKVGDIITVLIDDYTITTAVKENVASDTRNRTLSASAQLPSGTSKGAGINSRNDATSQQRGSARRENRFQNEMSVRIVAVGPDGLLQVKGSKNINVDKNLQDIVLTGWVRAQDISAQNSVESARVADVSIGYASPGPMAKPKQGIVTKILGAFWP